LRGERAEHVQAAERLHAKVYDEHVRSQIYNRGDRTPAVGAGRDDRNVFARRE
jgi:hypothetical protein